MLSHSINILLNVPELHICQVHEKADVFFLDVKPVTHTKPAHVMVVSM